MHLFPLFIRLLGTRAMLLLLFIINFGGTVYGYIWYGNQLMNTDIIWWPFVPDSPTASLFFTIVLLAFIIGRKFPTIEAFAAVTLVKYGIWASVIIVATAYVGGTITWQHYMLLGSHIGMAVQAVLFVPYYTYSKFSLSIVAVWLILNDLFDYVMYQYIPFLDHPLNPWFHSLLEPHRSSIFVFTVVLSATSIVLFYWLLVRRVTGKMLV